MKADLVALDGMPATDNPNAVRRMRRMLAFIKEFQRAHGGVSPTVREIGRGADISSTSVTNYYLEKLEDAGKIRRARNISRSIQVIGEVEDAPPADGFAWVDALMDSGKVTTVTFYLADDGRRGAVIEQGGGHGPFVVRDRVVEAARVALGEVAG